VRLRAADIARGVTGVQSVRSHTVTLTGEVGSQAEKERAARIAASAFTAGHVRNRLQVRTDW
jgi:osmotically-inducible protein OsmY